MLFYFNCLKGTLYIKSKLMVIDISKKLFLNELERGVDVAIPMELQNQRYPMSCRYYDFIIDFAKSNINPDK